MASSNYSIMDRVLHRVAFDLPFTQEVLCSAERALHEKVIDQTEFARSIFVISLARGGTTALLEVLARHPATVTHTYRDMPFVASPILWSGLGGRFRTTEAKAERAHGDGIMINVDSPEAFEEILWKKQFPDHYKERGITVWMDEEPPRIEFLSDHIRRLVCSRQKITPGARRYTSKNNANIARLTYLQKAYPDALFLVPLRSPVSHAVSMYRQHLRFLKVHSDDAFAKRYMSDLGHFEFGELHRPIMFGGMEDVIDNFDPTKLDYWVAYWINAYRTLMNRSGVIFVDIENLAGSADLNDFFALLSLDEDESAYLGGRKFLRPLPVYSPDGCDPSLVAEAREIYDSLRSLAHFA